MRLVLSILTPTLRYMAMVEYTASDLEGRRGNCTSGDVQISVKKKIEKTFRSQGCPSSLLITQRKGLGGREKAGDWAGSDFPNS